MMSIAAMGVGEAAADYCIGSIREDYYSNGGDPLGLWQGLGCASLGLDGAVQAAEFRAVLQGSHPRANQPLTGSGSGTTAHQKLVLAGTRLETYRLKLSIAIGLKDLTQSEKFSNRL